MAWIAAARKVLERHQHARVHAETGEVCSPHTKGAVILDATSANALVTVHDALSEANAAKFAAMPVPRAVDLAWQILNRQK